MTDHKCSECGESFDSERGLKIHQSQKHPDMDEEKEDDSSTDAGNAGAVSLSALQFGGLAFALGLLLGVVLGAGGTLTLGADGALMQAAEEAPSVEDSNTGNDAGGVQDENEAGSSSTVDVSSIDLEGEPVLGDKDAPVTMVIYEDFQCPFCKRFEDGAVSQVESEYVESGDVKIVWKDFPLEQIHPQAVKSAEVLECVYRQDNQAFWNVKKKIFDNHDELYPQGPSGYETTESEVEQKLIQWASEEGVSSGAIEGCMENDNPGDEVQSDLKEGQNFDTTVSDRPFVSGTPGTVIFAEGDSEGEPIVGAQPFSAVQSIIEAKLE